MSVSHRRGKTSHAEDHTDSLSEAVGKGDRSTVRGSEPHIVPGDPYIYEDTDDGKKCQKQCLSAVSASGAGQQKSFRIAKNRINTRRSKTMIPLCSGCPIPMSPRRKLRTKIPTAIVHAFRFLFHNCRDNTKRTMERHAEPCAPSQRIPAWPSRSWKTGKRLKGTGKRKRRRAEGS